MVYCKHMQWAKQKGFTIVELLIVIVVIAILAAITIVAYNGITTRANNTQTFNAVAAHARAINSYAADKGTYPVSTYSCLGPVGTRCSNTTDTSGPSACGGYGQAATQNAYVAAMNTITTSLPTPSSQTMQCSGKAYGGAWYYSAAGQAADLVAFLAGDVPCQDIGGLNKGVRLQVEGMTVCRYHFLAL